MAEQDALIVNHSLRLSPDDFEISFIHASGPGGQNVNKVATAAQLRFNVNKCRDLNDDVRSRLYAIAGNRINKEGELVITARRMRSQARNRDDAIQRLLVLLTRASRRPTRRIKTRPSRAVKRRRLDNKNRRGKVKANRRKPGAND